MRWPEAEAAIEGGAIVRRPEWKPGWTLHMAGPRMVLHKDTMDMPPRKNGRPRSNAGFTYWPSAESQAADDWEIFQG